MCDIQVQALTVVDGEETLTALGTHLANLPVDVHIGKMILFGAIFRCLDPVLTIAAALSYKSPFVRPFGQEAEADKARAQFKEGKREKRTYLYRLIAISLSISQFRLLDDIQSVR